MRAYQDWTRRRKLRPARRIMRRCSRVSGGKSCHGIDGGFQGLD
jgi:hypothetical protein